MSAKPFPPVRISVVGVGSFGRLHALTLAGLAEADLVEVVDSRESALAEMQAVLPDVPGYTDLNAALQQTDTEAWVIATRTASHVPLAELLLRAGKRVLIEKPLAENLETARRLAPLVTPGSSNLMLGHLALFAPEFRRLVQETRRRGPLTYFHLFRHRPAATADLYPEETPLRLTMVHDLYLAYALMNGAEPVRLSARFHPRAGGGCDLALAEMEWENGTWASFTASFLTPPGLAADGYDRMELFGPGWAAQIRLNPQPLELYTERAEWPLGLDITADPVAPSGWLAEELRCFCRVARGREEPPLGARYADALRLQEWMERLERSAV